MQAVQARHASLRCHLTSTCEKRSSIHDATQPLAASFTSSALQALGDGYRIILRRQDPARMLLGNIMQFRFPEERIQSPIAALQRIFVGVHVPVEVFHVNMTALSAHSLCSHLQDFNPGVLQFYKPLYVS